MNHRFAERFATDSDFEVVEHLDQSLPTHYFPEPGPGIGRDGLLVRFSGHSRRDWLGMFAAGDISPNGVSGVFTCPDANRLCVVSSGLATYVCPNDPGIWETVPLEPVMGVHSALPAGVLVLHDFTRFVAYGESGLLWQTPSLSWDGINSLSVKGENLEGFGWDAPSGAMVAFQVRLSDGYHVGGASPELLDAHDR